MQATRHTKLHKAFSAFTAFALALLMVPIVPGSTQVAAAADDGWALGTETAADTGLATTVVVNNLDSGDNAPITQTLDTDKIIVKIGTFAAPASTDDATKTALNGDVADAAKAHLKETAEATAATDEAKKLDAKITSDTSNVNDAAKAWLATGDGQTTVDAAKDSAIAAAQSAIGTGNYEEGSVQVVYNAEGTAIVSGNKLTASELIVKDETADLIISDTPAVLGSGTVSYDATTPNSLSVTSATPTDSSVVTGVSVSDGKLTFTAASAGTTTFSLGYSYELNVTGYQLTYSGSYKLSYEAANYENWKFTPAFTYTWKDNSGVEQSSGATTVNGDQQDVANALISYSGDATTPVSYTSASPATAENRSVASGVTQDSTTPLTTSSMSVVNLFPTSLDRSDYDAQTLTYYTDNEGKSVSDIFKDFEFGTDTSAARSHALEQITADSASVTSDDGSFSVSFDSAADALVLKPVKVLDGGTQDTATFTWTLPDNTKVTHTIKATVEPLEVTYAIDDQPFRLLDVQQERVTAAANSAIQKAIADASGETISASYFGATVQFDGTEDSYYDSSLASQNVEPQWGAVEEDPAYSNYKVVHPSEVTVEKLARASWGESDKLELASSGAKGEVVLRNASDAETWVKDVPTASYEGHKLAYQSLTVPRSAAEFNDSELADGDGIHQFSIYALDDDAVITEITDIVYRLDRQKPVIGDSKATSSKSNVVDNILFGDKSIDVEFSIQDPAPESTTLSEITQPIQSGVAASETKAWYDDAERGDEGKGIAADLNIDKQQPNTVLYNFTINSEADVPTSSIWIQAADNAGNVMNPTAANETSGLPLEYARLIADGDAPKVTVSWANTDARNGNYYANYRSMTIRVEDAFFNYVRDYNNNVIATVSQNGETVISIYPTSFRQVGDNVWEYTLDFRADADWSVSTITVSDMVHDPVTASGDTFTIDTTLPTRDVSFDNNNASNGNYYNASRTATITITEHNFNAGLVNIEPTANAGNGDSVGSPDVSDWSNNGDVHTATVYFPGEGVYTLSVSGTDSANNELPSYSESEFIIDTTTPQIQISGVDNRQAYSGSAQPSVTVQDTNVSDATTIELSKISYPMSNDDANPYSESRSNATTEITASYPDADQVVSNDGVYTLTVHAVDMAGNTADQAVTWSVNRFGSTYVLSDTTTKMLNNYLQGSKVSNVVVTEINPSGLNEGATAVELTHDTSNSTLKLGSDYGISASDSSGWSEYTYNVQKSNFDSDGSYRVLFHSEDVASNTSENTMKNKNASRTATAEVAFAVDDTAPIVSFIDLDSNGLYEESTHTAQVSIEDNLKLDTAEVTIDGEKALELDSAALSSSSTHSFDVPESASTHEIVVTAYDAAGNAETVAATNVTVTTDPVKLWMNNTPLFVGTIVGGIVVIGAIVAFAVMRIRRPSL